MTKGGHLDGARAGVPGALLADRYRLGERIGRGGMAEVFRAEDEVLYRAVAVKMFRIDPVGGDARRRVDAEVRMLAALRHPGLVTVFDAGTVVSGSEVTPFLVMELITGPTLGRRLQDGPLTAAQVAQLAADLAETLGYVHAAGVVHRDIKPANILLDTPTGSRTEFSAKLTDFGVARLMDSTRLTMHGMTVGTANYLSPEQAQGAPLTPASDVYSLGLVLLECLTGEVAFPGTGIEAAAARLHRPPAIPDWLPPEWIQLLAAMTAPGPGERPTTQEVGLIAAGLDGQPVPAGAPQAGTPAAAGAATTVTTVLPGNGPGSVAGPSHTRPLTTLLASGAPGGSTRRVAPRAWRAAVAGIVLAAVAVVVIVILLAGHDSKLPNPSPSYPSVSGQLGTHLKQLEGTLP